MNVVDVRSKLHTSKAVYGDITWQPLKPCRCDLKVNSKIVIIVFEWLFHNVPFSRYQTVAV